MRIDKKLLDPWKIIGKEKVFEAPRFFIEKYSAITPLGTKIPGYHVLDTNDSVMCVCVTVDGLILIEKQWRLPLGAVSTDFPAGRVEESDRSVEEAAIRELREETGYVAGKVEKLFTLDKDPSISRCKMHVFLMTNAKKVEEPDSQDELVETLLLTPSEILDAVEKGEISCAFCVATTLKTARKLGW